MKNFVKSEDGQALILMVMSLTTLVGFLGMATDIGLLYHDRQEQQTAADAAALAAAQDYMYNSSTSSAQTAGYGAATANGYTTVTGGATVTVNLPPTSGPNQSAGFAEAIVTQANPLSFLQIFGHSTATVTARAVAGVPTAGNACIWLMASTGVGMDVQGSYDIEAPNCGVYVNSSTSNAVKVTGNGGTMNTKFVDVVGNVTPQHQTSPTPITEPVAPRTNPWANITGPTTPGGCGYTSAATTITTGATSGSTVNEAAVDGSLISKSVVCFSNAVTINNGVSLGGTSTGVVYVFENGVTIGTGATVTFGSGTYSSGTGTFSNTSGAVMDIASGSMTQNSNSLLNVYAPTAGTYNGIAILMPATNTTGACSHPGTSVPCLQVQFGSNNETLDGYIYAPGAEVYLQDSGGGIKATGIVADNLYDKTSQITIDSYDIANGGTTPNRQLTLVE